MNALSAALVSALVGLAVGPFLHTLIHRTPLHVRLRGIRAHCSNCGTPTRGAQRHSLLAIIKKQRHCHTCSVDLFPDAPKVEIATVLLMAVVGWQLGWSAALPAYWVFFLAAVVIIVVDLRLYIIPTLVVYPAVLVSLVILAVAALLDNDIQHLQSAAVGMVGCWFFYFLLWLFYPRGMGLGDVRLALLVGLMTGWIGTGNSILAVFLGFLLGAGVGVLLIIARFKSRKDHIPFGPFMLGGAMLTILFSHGWQDIVFSWTGGPQ